MSDIALQNQAYRTKKKSTRFTLKQQLGSQLLFYVAVLLFTFIVSCAIVPQWIAPFSPTEMNMTNAINAPSTTHIFGTDYFGRDIFSVVVHGARSSLIVGFVSVVVGVLIGCSFGAIAGYVGGKIDTLFMRVNDVLMTIPGILLALAIASALGPSLFNIIVAVALASVPGYARIMRAQILSVKGKTFILAARSIGVHPLKIFIKHVLPHAMSPILVVATIGIGTSILAASGLSFLGLGVLTEIPDWGMLLAQGRGYISVAWWICTFPGLAITLFVLAVNIIGDRLRDKYDPKQKR